LKACYKLAWICPYKRYIRGDGNCFNRATTFVYPRNHPFIEDVNKVFQMLGQIDMGICENYPIPFRYLCSNRFLTEGLRYGWRGTPNSYKSSPTKWEYMFEGNLMPLQNSGNNL